MPCVLRSSAPGSASPAGQTIGTRPMVRRTKLYGAAIRTDTVRAASSADTVNGTPGSTVRTPTSRLPGSLAYLRDRATADAVRAEPSEQVTPSRRVKLAEVESASHFSARPDTVRPSGAVPTNES
ncbi:hypothetical protein TPA0905_32920 [Streptomyces olivaceus]|nr:hypothetical protein TPA0905_32920 [Streptomyces olivaceus]